MLFRSSLLKALDPSARDAIFSSASDITRVRASDLEFKAMQIHDEKGRLRRHRIELIKKFTLSVACLIMLFIGAPLGAIIRKGGLGTPLVISVLLFLVYYIIDNTGYKLARDGRWIEWCGMWLSTFVLLPLGIFVTYKAMNDSAVFNRDVYLEWIRRRLGLPETRQVALKEVVINDVNVPEALDLASTLEEQTAEWTAGHSRPENYLKFWTEGYPPAPVNAAGATADRLAECLSDSRDVKINAEINKLPVITSLWVMYPFRNRTLRKIFLWFAPAGLIVWLVSLPYARRVARQMKAANRVARSLREMIERKIAGE